jgi:hypothetical protein
MDNDGALNRVEYKEFLKSIDVWGRSDAYTDVFWGWTVRFYLRFLFLMPLFCLHCRSQLLPSQWRRICEQAGRQPTEGLDFCCFARRYMGGPGRSAMLATDLRRVRSASALASARRPSESIEVTCAKGHIMPLVPWSAGLHNPVGYQGGWLCDDCGRSCTDLGQDATRRFFCASCKSDFCRDCGRKASQAATSRNATERPAEEKVPSAQGHA